MLNNIVRCGRIKQKKQGMWLDHMNRNTIISLAMLYALWESNRQDLLDLIRPFILFSVGKTTKIGERIDLSLVAEFLEQEFGYRSFQIEVVKKILLRETATTIPKSDRIIKRRDNGFYLSSSLSDFIDRFSEKRTVCKSHSDAVTAALSDYLNNSRANNRNNYSQSEAETKLLSFFERQGSSILLSVDDLSQIMARDNEIDYYIGKFIFEENEKKSVLMDYTVELVKGYFVTTALYLQAENNDVTRASFSDVTFFLDTRLLLGYLGYKSKQENDSVQEMVKSLQRKGARLACFGYNEDEVDSILEAYKQSTVMGGRHSFYTLEYFDEHGRSYSHVDAAQKLFRKRLTDGGITSVSPAQAITNSGIEGKSDGLINNDLLKEILLRIKTAYNTSGLPDDIEAINTVSRLREGKRLPYIEKCKAVFVTTNSVLVSATKKYAKDNSIDYGFPIAITGEDLCVLAWLKDFEQDNNLPRMRLLENVLAAITPSTELMDSYFSNLEMLLNQGTITQEEVTVLRVDQYARKELMELTKGKNENLTPKVIEKIRESIKADSFASGVKYGASEAESRFHSRLQEQKNALCKRAEEEVNQEYSKIERRWIVVIKTVMVVLAIAFIGSSIVSLLCQWPSVAKYAFIIVALVTMTEGALPFFQRDNFIIRFVKNRIRITKLKALDKRKQQYLDISGIETMEGEKQF